MDKTQPFGDQGASFEGSGLRAPVASYGNEAEWALLPNAAAPTTHLSTANGLLMAVPTCPVASSCHWVPSSGIPVTMQQVFTRVSSPPSDATSVGGNRLCWEPSEDRTLMEATASLGTRWREIAKLLPGRSDDAVRNRWKRLMEVDEASTCYESGKKRTYERSGGMHYRCSK